MFIRDSVLFWDFKPTKILGPVNPQDKVVVVAVIAEKEDALVYIIAHVTYALLRIIFEIY